MRFTTFILSLLLWPALTFVARGENRADSIASDTTIVEAHRMNIVETIINYLNNTNKTTPAKKIDYSFIGGPFYSSESKFGIGLVAAANYYVNLEDSAAEMSDASLYGQLTTSLLYTVGIRGNHIADHNNFRVVYNVKFFSFPTAFWGIGFDENHLDSDKVKYKDFHIGGKATALWRLKGTDLFIGPAAEVVWDHARDIDGDKALWHGQKTSTTSVGAGFSVNYDTRDNLTAPERGWLVDLHQMFYPRFMGNGSYGFSSTDFSVNYYTHLWRGATLANRFHAFFSYGNTPWNMMGYIGGSQTMRGYYEQRYRDKCALDLTVELRQHVWRRSGIVVWGGLASVFSRFDQIQAKKLLPCVGVGYRWEFKKHTNVRLDFGIGRGETAIIFNINEAF